MFPSIHALPQVIIKFSVAASFFEITSYHIWYLKNRYYIEYYHEHNLFARKLTNMYVTSILPCALIVEGVLLSETLWWSLFHSHRYQTEIMPLLWIFLEQTIMKFVTNFTTHRIHTFLSGFWRWTLPVYPSFSKKKLKCEFTFSIAFSNGSSHESNASFKRISQSATYRCFGCFMLCK